MAFEGLLVGARGSVPEPYRVVERSRRERRAIRRQGDRPDRVAMAFEGLLVGARGSVPEPYRVVVRSRRERRAIRREGDRPDRAAMAFEGLLVRAPAVSNTFYVPDKW